ncbi:LacI family DNA-binding transcriptional regulator [soil metagenome]
MSEVARTATKRTTIADVAKLAGVGKVTVSYVLNGQSRTARISDETSRRVTLAAQQLNYRPNALGRMLSRQRADAVAVVFQYASYFSSRSGFTSEAMRGVCAACVESDVDLMLHTKKTEDVAGEAANLMDGRVDGVLILRNRGDETLAKLTSNAFPTVLFFTREYDSDIPFVDANNQSGGRMATEHLISLGHRRIAMLGGPVGSVAADDRFIGYQTALDRAGIAYDPALVLKTGHLVNVREVVTKFMKLENRPTAIFAWSDDDALESIRILGELGYSVPCDVSVVGFDSSDNCEFVVPPLTSVRQPVFEMAFAATELLVKLVRGTEVTQTQIEFEPELVIRSSTGPTKATCSQC